MDEVTWMDAGAVPWLVTHRPDTHPVAGGVSYRTGLLHQPVELLGVASLLAAWLTTSLARPVEATDRAAGADPVKVGFSLGQTESSLVVVGTADTVGAALQRVGQLLDNAAGAEVDDGLRDRARTYLNPLGPWRAHLAARWPGHPPHLSALGPLALDGLDAAALGRFVAERVGPAGRVYWANDPVISERVTPAPALPGPAVTLPAPAGGMEGPGCVVQRSTGELFTSALPAGITTELALTLLLRSLHRRMVEFEPLATDLRISRYEVGGDTVLACADADVVPGKHAAARAAAVQTIEDLAAGAVSAEEIAQVRAWYANAERAAPAPEPGVMAALARRHLRYQDFPTPAAVAAACEQIGEEQVRAALADAYRRLLLAVPADTQSPFPIVERVKPRKAEGRRFRDRLTLARAARCSARRVGIVGAGGRTMTSVDFDEVVLRLETGDQSTTLVDRQLGSVQLAWSAYRRGGQLRRLVDRRTPPIPVIHQPPDPEWPERLAAALRRQRRRTLATAAGLLGLVVALFVVIGVGEALEDDPPSAERTVETVDAGTAVTLPDGTTVGIASGPELIEHYYPDRPYTYAVQARMCGGEGRDGAGTFFSTNGFRLDVGEQRQSGFSGIPERTGPREDYLAEGECATGWLLYHLAEPGVAELATLHYANVAGDRVTWRLPPPSPSPLSKPCPTEAPAGIIGEPVWLGCPTPTPPG